MDRRTIRLLRWACLIAIVGIIDLAATIHAQAAWHAPAGTEQSTTLVHVLGFVTSIGLLAIAATLAVSQVRRVRAEQRIAQLRQRALREARSGDGTGSGMMGQ